MGSYLHVSLHIPYTYLHHPYTENVKRLTGLTVMSYDRDLTDREIYLKRFDTLIDMLKEIIDTLQMILENQNQAYLLAGIKQDIDVCNRIGCNHHIDYHKLFNGCQVSECECEQFDRKQVSK